MASPIIVSCPECGKKLGIAAESVGKKIRCKACSHIFLAEVPIEQSEKPKPQKVAAKASDDAPLKLAAETPAPKKPYADADDDNDNSPYRVTVTETAPRCPQCTALLDPPEAKVCLECGYNLITRKRSEPKKVQELVWQDYAIWWSPAIGCLLGIAALITLCVICNKKMESWMTGGWFDTREGGAPAPEPVDEKEKNSVKSHWIVRPSMLVLWVCIPSFLVSYKLGRFAYSRLVNNWVPPQEMEELDFKKKK